MAERLRGIFPVLQSPVDAQGEIDEVSLKREVAFCLRAGAHGLVFPVLGGEFYVFSDCERQRMVEIVVGEASHQIPVVVGVAGTSRQVAAEHARHAARIHADAVIALPPYIDHANAEEALVYYRTIADAAQMPVFIQHSGAGLDAAFLVRLLREVPNVRYIKEEAPPSAHNIQAVVKAVGEECWGVFGGGFGRWMISETRRGAVGFMPAAEVTDVNVAIWEALEAGDEAGARRIFNQMLPLINLAIMLGLRVCKEVLVRRGVIATATMRTPGQTALDEEDYRELDAILADLRPLFRV